jgi:hypothetical protein
VNTPLAALSRKRPGDLCLICGGAPDVIGIFVPETQESWGGAKGKDRIFRYCLCGRCNGRGDKADRVEKIIRAELAGGGVHHAG